LESKEFQSEAERQYYQQILNALNGASIINYKILDVLEDDHILMFDLRLETNLGMIEALNVPHIHIHDENVVEAFKQILSTNFGNVLKKDLLNHIQQQLNVGCAPYVSIL
jgi:hypothetical protein